MPQYFSEESESDSKRKISGAVQKRAVHAVINTGSL
jgi:hypothetical protein